MHNTRPIGIFDSGIGGLTVARAITRALPGENIVYFGDTAHLPYGDKSSAAIQAYSIKVCNILLQQDCKAVLIACNSASSAAFDLVKEYIGSRAAVFNVIDPIIAYIGQHYAQSNVGLIGTKQTVGSDVYKNKIEALQQNITLKSLATPLLAPMIEEGFFNNKISYEVIESYLQHDAIKDIKALILGCTHYPLIKDQIHAFYQDRVEIIDSAEKVAAHIKLYMETHGMLNTHPPEIKKFYVSDYTDAFEASTRIFFQEQVSLAHYPLWE